MKPHENKSIDVAVIGGGAAGFFAAIACAEEYPQARVTIYETGAHVLTKVRISGGGRCNVTNACFDPKLLIQNYPRGNRALLGPFHKFQPKDTMEWFESRGVHLKTEEDGRVFPATDTSVTIINALKDAANAAGVTVKTYAGLKSIQKPSADSRFLMTRESGERFECDRVLLATGSGEMGYQWAKLLGHSIVTPVPSLFTMSIPDGRLNGLSGLSVENAELEILGTGLRERGPVLITHWGLSGPAILKLSAWGARALHDSGYRAQLKINWLSMDPAVLEEKIRKHKNDHARGLIKTNSPFPIPHRLWERLVETSKLSHTARWGDLSGEQMKSLINALSTTVYLIRGKSTFKEEFVTAGGVNLDEVDFKTMESKICQGLYFAGEILDIDAVTGGFNFQNAWTTGWLAGRALGK